MREARAVTPKCFACRELNMYSRFAQVAMERLTAVHYGFSSNDKNSTWPLGVLYWQKKKTYSSVIKTRS